VAADANNSITKRRLFKVVLSGRHWPLLFQIPILRAMRIKMHTAVMGMIGTAKMQMLPGVRHQPGHVIGNFVSRTADPRSQRRRELPATNDYNQCRRCKTLAVWIDLAADPPEARGQFSLRQNRLGQNDRAGMHAARDGPCNGEGCAGGIGKEYLRRSRHGTGLGPEVSQHKQSSAVGHAVEAAVFSIDSKREELIGGA